MLGIGRLDSRLSECRSPWKPPRKPRRAGFKPRDLRWKLLMARPKKSESSGANLGFEAKLWLAADKLRNNMDAAEYKHVVLGLIFLKYISDTFEEHRAKLVADTSHSTHSPTGFQG